MTQMTSLEMENLQLKTENHKLQTELEQANNSINQLNQMANLETLKDEFKTLTEQIKKARSDRRAAEDEKIEIENEKESITKDIEKMIRGNYTEAVKELLEKARKSSPMISLLTGMNKLEHEQDSTLITINTLNINNDTQNGDYSHEELRNKIFGHIYAQLNRLKYKIDPKILALILISLAQNTLVMLAGDPGSGKTSICKLLAEILYINHGGFAYTPVARDWTTSNNLIGFHNNICNRFQPANNDVYKLMLQTNHNLTNSKSKLNLVLLDEANLSPLEYYLSDFIGQWDQEKITIKTSYNTELVLDHKFKMIATLNSDHTTESISPRMRDRANIIWLDSKDAKLGKVFGNDFFEFSADEFFYAFTNEERDDKDNILQTFLEIEHISLSERKKRIC